ncbi:MAG: hypothetical protein IPH42_18495 [Bacteroidetes bacterium]|nr:hypothetical protein [Bacteroidota bacterium]
MVITEIHNLVFDYLTRWSDTTDAKNNLFYIRTKQDERFKKGYWFPGDESYVAISFWTGGDSLNRTPNIYFCIEPDRGIFAYIIARDSINKKKYFQALAQSLEGYSVNKNKDIWSKQLGTFEQDKITNLLSQYLENDKEFIDEYIRTTLDRINESDSFLLEDEY